MVIMFFWGFEIEIITNRKWRYQLTTTIKAKDPEKYALASDFLAHRADRPKDYKPETPPGRMFSPSPYERRLLVLTGIYKHESDIPEFISDFRIAMMKERLNFVASIFWLSTLVISILITIRAAYSTMALATSDSSLKSHH